MMIERLLQPSSLQQPRCGGRQWSTDQCGDAEIGNDIFCEFVIDQDRLRTRFKTKRNNGSCLGRDGLTGQQLSMFMIFTVLFESVSERRPDNPECYKVKTN